MIEVRRVWRHANEAETLHFILTAGDKRRHIKFQRSGNPAMYDFIVDNGPIPMVETRTPISKPETSK